MQALQVARQQLSGAAAEAKQAEKALAELETAIPKVSQLQYSTPPSLLLQYFLPIRGLQDAAPAALWWIPLAISQT